MEDPTAQPSAATTNGEHLVKIESASLTVAEDFVIAHEPSKIDSRLSSINSTHDEFEENVTKKLEGPVKVTSEEVTSLPDDSRASLEEAPGEETQSIEPPEHEEPCRSGNPGEDATLSSARSEEVTCLKPLIACSKCHISESLFWRTSTNGELICVECQGTSELGTKDDADEELSQAGSDPPTTPSGSDHIEEAEDLADQDDAPPKAPSPRKRELRKATRLKTAKYVKSAIKNRRSLTFKKTAPLKTTPSVSHFITSNYVRHKGSYLQRGDIVSMLGDDSEIYYAQLRTFLVDQFGQLSATISWLIPTERSPTDGSFDPATFVLGPEEDFPRDLRSMSFECHAPSDYYLARDKPILFDERKGCKAFVWTTVGKPKAIRETPEAQ